MSEMIKDLVPLQEVESDRIDFQLNFPPYIPVQRIGMNVRRVDRLIRLGGIRSLTITGTVDDEVSNSVPQVVGFTSKGEAFAAKAKTETMVPTHTEKSSFNAPQQAPHRAIWIDAALSLNLSEMSQRIMRDEKWVRGARSAGAWSNQMDSAIREGITHLGVEHLTHPNKYNKSYVLKAALGNLLWFALTASALSQTSLYRYISDPRIFLPVLYGVMLGEKDIQRKKSGFFPPEGYRLSLLWGPEYDRALVLKILSKSMPIIQELPQKAE